MITSINKITQTRIQDLIRYTISEFFRLPQLKFQSNQMQENRALFQQPSFVLPLDSSFKLYQRESYLWNPCLSKELFPRLNSGNGSFMKGMTDINRNSINPRLQISAELLSSNPKILDFQKYTNQFLEQQNIQVGSVYSQSQELSIYQQEESPVEQGHDKPGNRKLTHSIKQEFFQAAPKRYSYEDYFNKDVASFLSEKQIPFNYIRGLLMIRNIKQLKTKREIKVQRYLKKREKKTWNKKICYNCRQKVAGERLRIKGKFIKKRFAMEMLGIKTAITMQELRSKLIAALEDKTQEQINEFLAQKKYGKKSKRIKK